MKPAMLFIFAACAVFCQDAPKPAPKPFTEPPVAELSNPALVARDEGCAKDLAKAARLQGIEQTKYVAGLFKFGCVRVLPGERHPVTILDVRKFGEGDGAVPVRKVIFLIAGGQVTCWSLASPIPNAILNSALESLPKAAMSSMDDIVSWVVPTNLGKQ